MTEHPFPAGAVVFRPGDAPDRAYLIHAGQVELAAGPRLIALLGPKDFFGEAALLEGRPHDHTARALTDVIAVGLTGDEFERLLADDPVRLRRYLRGLYARLRPVPAADPDPPKPTAPSVVLFPLTPQMAMAIPAAGLPVPWFPFRVGRRVEEPIGNDLALPDGKPYTVSRQHLALELTADGAVVVRDRGSQLGTLVNGEPVGGAHGRPAVGLADGENELVLGPAGSPFRFRVVVS